MDSQKKKLLKIGALILGTVVLVVIILLIVHAITSNKNVYSKIENDLVKAAEKYYKENDKLLPKEGEQKKLTDAQLASTNHFKGMAKYTTDACTGEVVVTNNNSKYRYTALLNCNNKYKTKTLVEVLKSKGIVTSGIGLYEMNGELVYRGETPNNYVRFSGKRYRIVKVTDNGILLILNEKTKSAKWDTRYNVERNYSEGINDYEVSRIKDAINSLDLVKDTDKGLVSKQTLYIGKRSERDITNDGAIEKAGVLENQTIGLLPLYDYINASIDKYCASAVTNSCANYNYLNRFDYNWWTITADNDTTYKVYRISSTGGIDLLRAATEGYMRPTILLLSDTLYVSGDGTEKNPYKIK